MALTKPSVLPVWGETNTTSADMVQPANGDIQTGWPLSSTPPSRQRWNWFMNYVMNAVRYFARRGASDWDAAETYMTGDRVIGPDGLCYMSLQDTNLNKTPASQPTWWLRTGLTASEIQKQAFTYCVDVGAANAYAITPSPAITAYAQQQRFQFIAANANTGASTLNVNALGTKAIRRRDGTALVAGDIPAGAVCDVEYDGTNFQLLSGVQAAQTQVNAFSAFTDTGAANAYVITPVPAISAYAAKQYWFITIGAGNTNTAGNPTPTAAVSGLTARNIVKQNGAPYIGGELVAGTTYEFVDNGTSLVQIGSAGRTRLSTNLSLYVATTGTDSLGRGLAVGTPFLTLQYAYNFILNYLDLNGYSVTINTADGTYTVGLSASGQLVGASTSTPVTISGNSGTPSNVLINVTSGNCFYADRGASLLVTGVKVQATGSNTTGNGIFAGNGGAIAYSNVVFGACANASAYAGNGGLCIAIGANFKTAGGVAHLLAVAGGTVADGQLTTLSGTPAFTGGYAQASKCGTISSAGATFSGSATGPRSNVYLNGVIDTNGGGASFYPGSTANTSATGGQYA